MSKVWRYLTHPQGMTTPQLAQSTGLSLKEVREDLVELEALGKAVRERGAVGQPHRWWRTEKRQLSGLDVLLYMALAAKLQDSPARLKEVLADVGSRAKSPAVSKAVAMCAMSRAPRQVIWEALENLDPVVEAELRAA